METKEYTTDQEQLARFAKAMGHPARIAILKVSSINSIYPLVSDSRTL